MNLYDEIITLIPNKKQHKLVVLKNLDINVYDKVMKTTQFLDKDTILSHRLLFIKNNISKLPSCRTCSALHQYVNDSKNISEYCCKECYYKDSETIKKRCSGINQNIKVQKMKETNKKKFGFEFNSQRPEIKEILSRSKLIKHNSFALRYLQNKEWMIDNYVTNGLTTEEIADKLNVYYGTVVDYLTQHNVEIRGYTNRSKEEREIEQFLKEHNINIETSKKGILNNKTLELDIFCKDYNLAIEVNGLYWHSTEESTTKARNKHLNKTIQGIDNNINVVHITDEQWHNKKNICKSIILNKLNLSNKIYARNCKIVRLSSSEYNKFLNDNHINGTSSASIKYGLMYNDIIVMVMSFSVPRFTNKYEYELIRLCTVLNHVVVGGTSKLFKNFIEEYNPSTIICYSDRQFGEGKVFGNIGFEYNNSSKPGYRWANGITSYNRTKFQKHKLSKILKIYDEKLSEKENMLKNRYKMIWDCGNNVWVYNNKKGGINPP